MKIVLSRLGGTLAAAAVGLFALASCAQAVGSVSLANAISDQLQKQSIDAQGVACPGDLQAAVGQTERCSFMVGGQPVDAIATVTSVDNGNVKYDITTEAHPIAKELLARKVIEQVTQQTRMPVDSATCVSDLQPTVNAITNCTLMDRAKPVPVTVTVTKVSGGLINFSIKQV